ncbi:MAG: penicillin-binding protein 2 [Pseudanabaenaceae cyanobacterium bins.68]|nr:penicillin-binding protein 2 [Pseudanabaenaceae cyanobacterium bins.68]
MALGKVGFNIASENSERTVGRAQQTWTLALLGFSLLLGMLGGRTAYLQLREGEKNRQLAENNRIRLIAKPPERGRIFDRKGKILASSRLAHVINLWPIAQKKPEWPSTIAKLATKLGVSPASIQSKLEQEGYNSPNLVRVSSALSPKLITQISESSAELPGVQVDPESVRVYPFGQTAAHLLGYTGAIDQNELKKLQGKGYRLRDLVGKAGVEYGFESRLRGQWGGQQVEVDAAGKVLRILGEKPPKPGSSLYLTIDIDLQKAAEKALGDYKGSIVALDPNNGEVLAMASYPGFDPNLFSSKISEQAWADLLTQDNPFLNRALRGFPPASTFKIVTLVAGIQSGKFALGEVLATYPYLDLGGILFWDNNRAGFGVIGFEEAMAYSSNTFFGQVGLRIGIETLASWARKFGFGAHTGIELAAEEAKGLVPDPQWKEQELKEPWYAGNTINTSIGQGFLQATPLQVAVMGAAIANGGNLVKPHLWRDDPKAKTWRKPVGIDPQVLKLAQRSLNAVFEYGTGQGLNYTSVAIAGKSGTAEDPPRQNHAWFLGYAPAQKPEIVVVVFLENSGGGGGKLAGPKVVQVIEAFMAKR